MRYAAALAGILAVSPALAADKGTPPPATFEQILALKDRPVTCYGGALGGFGLAASQVGDATSTIPLAATGLTGTLTGGCDLKSGPMLLGAWADYTLGNIKGRIVDGGSTAHIELDKQWAIGGRIGYYVQPSTIIFGSLGYTGAEAKAGTNTEKLTGFVLGGGLETKITDPVWFRFDAMRYLYKDEGIGGARVDTTATAVRAGVVVKF